MQPKYKVSLIFSQNLIWRSIPIYYLVCSSGLSPKRERERGPHNSKYNAKGGKQKCIHANVNPSCVKI